LDKRHLLVDGASIHSSMLGEEEEQVEVQSNYLESQREEEAPPLPQHSTFLLFESTKPGENIKISDILKKQQQ
jgi:hypothetical protein